MSTDALEIVEGSAFLLIAPALARVFPVHLDQPVMSAKCVVVRSASDSAGGWSELHAHLSAFSFPELSYQALRFGSEIASSVSCALIDAIPSAPLSPFGLLVCASHADGHRSGFPRTRT